MPFQVSCPECGFGKIKEFITTRDKIAGIQCQRCKYKIAVYCGKPDFSTDYLTGMKRAELLWSMQPASWWIRKETRDKKEERKKQRKNKE